MVDGKQYQDSATTVGKAILDVMGGGRQQQNSAHRVERGIAQRVRWMHRIVVEGKHSRIEQTRLEKR